MKLDVVVYAFNSNTHETEAVRSLSVQGQRGLHSNFQDSYIEITVSKRGGSVRKRDLAKFWMVEVKESF